MPAVPSVLFDTAGDLLACAVDALDAAGLPAPVRSFVANGTVDPLDNEGCCRQLSVRLVRVYPSTNPPAPTYGPTKCRTDQLVIDWEVLYLGECQPQVEGNTPPAAAALTAAAESLLAILWVLTSALACCLAQSEWRDEDRERRGGQRDGWIVGGSLRGPEGMCAGALVNLTTTEPRACDCRPPAV